MTHDYLVISYYILTPLSNPKAEVDRMHTFCAGRDMTGRIYISDEGINGQLSASQEDGEAYMDWLRSDERFKDVVFKVQSHHENAFPRMTIKVKNQLVALDQPIDFSRGGEHISPKRWREMLEDDEEHLVLDVRNDFEWEIGRFTGSERPGCKTFRDFPEQARRLQESYDPKKTKVMMCCTGGIRCEYYSVVMKDAGFEEVYQLDGGIIAYSQQEGGKHWEGKLFVFDDRLTVEVNPDASVVGTCYLCNEPADHPFNCANMDCNRLFLACPSCIEAACGCCAPECQESKRLRPASLTHKPFRRKATYKL